MSVKTGVKVFDDLFGGYEPAVITEFFGQSGVGKTTMSAYVPIGMMFQSTPGDMVVFDGDGGFDRERAMEIWKHMGLAPNEVIDRVHLFTPTEFEEQHSLIKGLDKFVDDSKMDLKLVVADAMTAIYRGIMLRTEPQFRMVRTGTYTGKLDLELAALRHVAVKRNCPVIVTTWSGSQVGHAMGGDSECPMIGGRAFSFVPKVIVELRRSDELDNYLPRVVREAVVYKHRGMPPGRKCLFEIYDGGVREFGVIR